MLIADHLSFGFGANLPVILQTEATECGIACLAMVASFHGHRISLNVLRRNHSVSLKGSTLADLIRIAEHLQLAGRPLKLEIEDLRQLRRPCILHWNLNHFVVLKEISVNSVTVHDPAVGLRKLSMKEMSDSFTGVALELWPNAGFKKKSEVQSLKIRELMGRVTGLFRSLSQILILALALEVFALVSPLFMQWVVDEAIVSGDRDLLTTLALGFGLLMLLQVAISAIRSWVLMHMSTTLNVQWRANVFTHLLRLPVQYFQKRHLGDVQSRFGSIDQIQNTVTTQFIEAILDGLMSLATLAMMFIYSSLLGWIGLGAMVLYGLSRWAWFGTLRAATGKQIVFAARQQSHFLESIRGVRTIKLFQREDQRRTTWLGLLVGQINAGLHIQRLQILFGSVHGVIAGVANILIIWLGARLVLDGHFTIGALMAFTSYNSQFSSRFSNFIEQALQFRMLKLHGERLSDIVLTEPESIGPALMSVQQDDSAQSANITVTNLRYRYAEHEPLVLDDVSFEIAEGESVAIVGPSGCGKTTLINVLLGVLPPTSGDVLVGGVNLKHIGTHGVRKMVGTVMQDDVLFAGSISDNISFFDLNADRAWVEECAKLAAVHTEIQSMPMGFNSLVGDMGTVLSGGQKQRVLLARALYKRPRILFLDEATSHLDVERERQVAAAIKGLNITRFIVAHRPETIASANRVISLRNGGIVSDAPRQTPPTLTSVPVVSEPEQEANITLAPSLPAAPSFMRVPPKS